MDCRSTSAADRVPDCGEGVQWPNERKPIFFIKISLLFRFEVVPDFSVKVVPVRSRLVNPKAFPKTQVSWAASEDSARTCPAGLTPVNYTLSEAISGLQVRGGRFAPCSNWF